MHRDDFYSVLGFEKTPAISAWMKYISSDMIDGFRGVELEEYGGMNFYDYLKDEFPGFKCKHRLLFHWGYNSRPWNDELQSKVEALPWGKDSVEVDRFRQTIMKEQQRRNGEANALTENLFGFASGGRDAEFANAMISIVYDIHLIGDYTPDNSDFDGVQDFHSVVGDLILALRKLDHPLSNEIVKSIQAITNAASLPEGIKAERLLVLLSSELPKFLQAAQDGSLSRRFKARGIIFCS